MYGRGGRSRRLIGKPIPRACENKDAGSDNNKDTIHMSSIVSLKSPFINLSIYHPARAASEF